MSERKSDEIKFRVEPSVKARWQSAADSDPQSDSLSDFIRRATDLEARVVEVKSAEKFNTTEPPLVPTSDCHNHGCTRKGCASCDYRTVGAVLGEHAGTTSSWKPYGADTFA